MSFDKQVSSYLQGYERRIRAVFRTSVQELAETASIPRAKGGRMPVVTAFLRKSIRAALNSTPSSASDGVAGALARWQPGDSITVGWTAVYAWPMEARYGFARGAAELWPRFVASAADEARSRGL